MKQDFINLLVDNTGISYEQAEMIYQEFKKLLKKRGRRIV